MANGRVACREMRRTGRRWRKTVAQFERKFVFVKLEKMVSVLLQAIMIEQEQFCALPRMGFCEAKVGQDKTLSDAWKSTNW